MTVTISSSRRRRRSKKIRTEGDSQGPGEVPAAAYYGEAVKAAALEDASGSLSSIRVSFARSWAASQKRELSQPKRPEREDNRHLVGLLTSPRPDTPLLFPKEG